MSIVQVEVGKRERMLANAEIEGIKKYHFKEMHDLQDQLLAQRSAVSKLTMRLQEAMQVLLHQEAFPSMMLCILSFLSSPPFVNPDAARCLLQLQICCEKCRAIPCREVIRLPCSRMR